MATQWKAKHSVPKMEDIVLKKEYAITYNPQCQHDDRKKILPDRLNRCIQELNSLLRECDSWVILRLYPELSPLGRVHFHGTLIFKDIVNSYMYVIRKLTQNGTLCIKPIQEALPESKYKNWHDYCTKQKSLFEDYMYKVEMPFKFPKSPQNQKGIMDFLIME